MKITSPDNTSFTPESFATLTKKLAADIITSQATWKNEETKARLRAVYSNVLGAVKKFGTPDGTTFKEAIEEAIRERSSQEWFGVAEVPKEDTAKQAKLEQKSKLPLTILAELAAS